MKKSHLKFKSKVVAFEIRAYPSGLSVNVRRLVSAKHQFDWRMYQHISPASIARALRCAPLLVTEARRPKFADPRVFRLDDDCEGVVWQDAVGWHGCLRWANEDGTTDLPGPYCNQSEVVFQAKDEFWRVVLKQGELPTLESLEGIAPDATGGLPSEEFVRRVRDDWR